MSRIQKRALAKTYSKNVFRSIWKTKLRFLAIFLMTLLGAAIYIGIIASGPNMRHAIDRPIKYFNREHIEVFSPLGLYPEDIQILESIDGVETLEYQKSGDFFMENSEYIIHLFSCPETLGLPEIIEGRAPTKTNEILLDMRAKDKGFVLNQVIEILPSTTQDEKSELETKSEGTGDENDEEALFSIDANLEDPLEKDKLKNSEFTIVGFADHIHYIMSEERGNTYIGDGKVDFFGMLPYHAFDKVRPDMALLKMEALTPYDTSSKKYRNLETQISQELEDLFKARPDALEFQIKGDYQKALDDGEKEIIDAKKRLADAEEELKDSRLDLDEAWNAYHEGLETLEKELQDGRAKLVEAKQELEDSLLKIEEGEAEYQDGLATYNASQVKLQDSKKDLATARQELDDGLAKWEAGRKQLLDKGLTKDAINQLQSKLDAGEKEIQEGYHALEAAELKIPDKYREMPVTTINAEIKALEQTRDDLLIKQVQLEDTRDQRADLENQLSLVNTQIAEIENQLPDGLKLNSLSAVKQDLEAKIQAIDETVPDIPSAINSVHSGLEDVENNLQALETANERVNVLGETKASLEAQISQTQSEIKRIENEIQALDPLINADNIAALETEKQAFVSEKARLENELIQTEEQIAAVFEKMHVADQNALEGAILSLDNQKADLNKQLNELESLDTNRKTLVAELAKLDTLLEKIQVGLPDGMTLETFIALPKTLEGAIASIDAKIPDIDQALLNLEEGLEKTKEGITGLKQIVLAKEEISNGYTKLKTEEKKLAEGKASLAEAKAAWTELDKNETILNEAENKYKAGLEQYEAGVESLKSAAKELEDARIELDNGQAKYLEGEDKFLEAQETLASEEAKGRQELADAKIKLDDGEAKYKKGLAEYNKDAPEARLKLADGEAAIAEGKDKLDAVRIPAYLVAGRYNDFAIYAEIENANNIQNLSLIFSSVFYLIAMLVTLTTISRMVEEERAEIGTLKAIGLSEAFIGSKYLSYAFLSSSLGSIAGIFIGYLVLMPIVFMAYTSGFDFLLPVEFIVKPWHPVIAYLIGAGLTLFAAWASVKYTFGAKAAELMRPKPPTRGNRTLLERIKPFWSRLNFMAKVSMRNLTAKKSRMFMTLLGVMGSTALVVMGFGLKYSIDSMLDKQHYQLRRYDVQIVYDNTADDADIENLLQKIEACSAEKTSIYQAQASYINQDGIRSDFLYNVVFDQDTYQLLAPLRNRQSGKALEIPEEGALLTERFIDSAVVSDENSIIIRDQMGFRETIEIAGELESYIGHSMILSPSYHLKLYNEEPKANTILIQLKDGIEQEAFVDTINQESIVYFANTRSDNSSVIDNLERALGVVVLMIIIISAMLTYVVLFNLTNLNVSERMREISTIKVLGFKDKEVTQYIYRETIILSVIGVFLGFIGGKSLHYMICFALSPSAFLIDPYLNPLSYLFSGLLVLSFSIIVMLIIHKHLKRINMVEALKEPD